MKEIKKNGRAIRKLELKRDTSYCEYCGREIEDTNDTGSLCYRCYVKEYYDEEVDCY